MWEDDQRRLPAQGVGVGEPRRRHVCGERSPTADGEVHAHRQGDVAASEILRDRRQRRDVERLRANAEQQPAGGHPGEAGLKAVSAAPATVDLSAVALGCLVL
jgi:hypothetical protein